MRRAVLFLSLVALLVPARPAPAGDDQPKASIYDAKLDAREQVAKATRNARHNNQRILVMFGGDWCGWCHKLHALMTTDKPTFAVWSDDYQLVLVDTKAPNAEALLNECKGDLPSISYPFLSVLDAKGQVIHRQLTEPLEEGDHHDPAKVRDFLAKWAPEKQDAEKVLADGLARAASEGKRVFVHIGAPWCGWCHKLEDFMEREEIAEILGKDFVDVKIDQDRMIHGKEVAGKLRKDQQGGIPWFVFLDGKTGEPIIDSDGPEGNVGYPAAPAEIAHFVAMLKKAARKIEPAEIDAMEKALKAAPEAARAAAAR